jgi:hypothetical protein
MEDSPILRALPRLLKGSKNFSRGIQVRNPRSTRRDEKG